MKKVDPATLCPGDTPFEVKVMLACQDKLGEMPTWDDRENTLIWTNVEEHQLNWLNFTTGDWKIATVPE